MPIIIKCDVCGAETLHATSGNAVPTESWDNTEKRCGGCSLSDMLTGWPAELNRIKAQFKTTKLPELKSLTETSFKNAFKRYAETAARAYFGAEFDEALPTIKPDIQALLSTPLTITIAIGD